MSLGGRTVQLLDRGPADLEPLPARVLHMFHAHRDDDRPFYTHCDTGVADPWHVVGCHPTLSVSAA